MLAARVHRMGVPPSIELEEIQDPQPAEGEALVRVSAAVLAHIDLTIASGDFPARPHPPYVPGTEGAGVIVSAAGFEVGQHVRIRGAGVGLSRDGTWAELVAVPERALTALPDDVPLALGAGFYAPACTALEAVLGVGALEQGEVVGVTGASGAVGSLAVQLALRAGAETVIGLVSRPTKADAVPDGATVRVGMPLEAVSSEEEHPDLWIDTVGGGVLEQLPSRTRPGGRIACVGYTAGESIRIDLPTLFFQDVRLLPVNLMRHPASDEDAAGLLNDLGAGRLRLAIEEHDLRALPSALSRLRAGEARGRMVLVP